MLDWVRRNSPTAILIPTALAAGTATALTNVPEVLPFGQELGLGVMGVGYSYIAAYIFNWLIVERPKAQALKDHYDATRQELINLAREPAGIGLLLTMTTEDSSADLLADGATRQHIEDALSRVDWTSDPFFAEIAETFDDLIKRQQKLHDALAPFLHHFDAKVSAAIGAMNSEGIRNVMRVIADHPDTITQSYIHQVLADSLVSYQRAGRRLGLALIEAKHMHLDKQTEDSLRYPGLREA